jgi:phosphoribosylcarboxyaminoimidazole (NCAIR) mutase
MNDKKVLVLFYDAKDRERELNRGSEPRTLEEDVKEGFGPGVSYEIRTASPRHEPWLILEYMNEQKYDGIIVVAGLSCSLDIPNMLMEQLYDNQRVPIKPRDWQNVTFRRKNFHGDEITDEKGQIKPFKASIDDTIESVYFQQQRPVPIIGVPTADPLTYGEFALASMLMSSRPSSAACVPVERGYQAARLMTALLTTPWKELVIVMPDKGATAYESDGTPKIRTPGHHIGWETTQLLDKEFTPYEDAKIPFHHESSAEYARQFITGKTVDKKPPENRLHICIYDGFEQIEDMNNLTQLTIGVYLPNEGRKADFREFNHRISQGLENVLHTRIGVSENAAVLAAHALFIANPKLVPSRFSSLRQKKSQANVEEFLKLWKVKGKNFEVE